MILIVRRVTVRVRVVRHARELANIVPSVVEAADAPTTVLEANARIVWEHENRIAPSAMDMVLVLFAGETTNCVQIVVGVTAQTSVNIVMAQEQKNVQNAPMETVEYVREVTIAENVMVSPNAVPVEATATVPNAKTTTANVLNVPATAIFG